VFLIFIFLEKSFSKIPLITDYQRKPSKSQKEEQKHMFMNAV